MQELCWFLFFFSPPRGHSDDEPLRFPLGEELDCLEENVKGGRTTGVNRVNS